MSVMAFESPGAVTETCKHAAAVLRLTNNLRISEASPEIFIHGENNNELWRAFVVFTVICEKEKKKQKLFQLHKICQEMWDRASCFACIGLIILTAPAVLLE